MPSAILAGIPLSPTSGVTVFVTASRANELAPTAHALAAALMAEGLIAGVTASAGPRMEQRPNVIVFEIGRKPACRLAPTRCVPLPNQTPACRGLVILRFAGSGQARSRLGRG